MSANLDLGAAISYGSTKNNSRKIPPTTNAQMVLEPSHMDRYDKILFLDDRTTAQIQVVAPGGLSNVSHRYSFEITTGNH